VRDGQLLVLRQTVPARALPTNPPNLAGSVPLEDLGILMVDERETTYSHSLLIGLAEHGGVLVVCGRDHHPAGMFIPLNSNSQLLARLDAQLAVSKPVVKQLWRRIVMAKIVAQAGNLADQRLRDRLVSMAKTVRSGDPDNREAVAAALYWPALFERFVPSPPFRRRPGEGAKLNESGAEAHAPNGLLDYGYAALRATVARALVSAGLLPSLGVKHIGRGNAFCLADDLMEPLRPIIDARVKYLAMQGLTGVEPTTKRELLKVLAEPVDVNGQQSPLMVGVTRMVAAFVGVLEGRRGDLALSDFPFLPGLKARCSFPARDENAAPHMQPQEDEHEVRGADPLDEGYQP